MIAKKSSLIITIITVVVILAVLTGLLIFLISKNDKDTGDTTDGTTTNGSSVGGSDTGGEDTGTETLPVSRAEYVSPSGISISSDNFIYVSNETGKEVYKLNPAGDKILETYKSEREIHNVVCIGDKVYVLEGGLGGKLIVLDKDLKNAKQVTVGHTPTDIAVKGNVAYVANRFSNTVAVVDLGNLTVKSTIKVNREPVALGLKGDTLYVGCHLPDDPSNATVVSAKVVVIDTKTDKVTKVIPLVNGATGVKDLCVSPDGTRVYVTHVLARYAFPTTQLDRGWINTNAVSIIDTTQQNAICAVLLDEVEMGAANPWGITISEDNKFLYVALSGTHEVMRIDILKLNTKLANVGKPNNPVKSLDKVSDYIPFLYGATTRIQLSGNGPRAITVKGGKVYVASYFSGDVSVIDTTSLNVSTITIKEQPEADAIRLGETLWYDATITYQKWQSCNSCHPDARSDGFNWDHTGDGLGNPKNTKSLLYTHRTPPIWITGLSPSGEGGTIGSVNGLLFNQLDDSKYKAIDAFLKSMLPVPSPYLNEDGTLTASAQKGKELFVQYGCVTCHPAPLYTDLQKHKSKTLDLDDSWEDRDFDTPTLIEIWRTAPYTFNGSITTIEEMVKLMATGISDADAKDLTEYVLSIGCEGEYYGVSQVYFTPVVDKINYGSLKPETSLTGFTVIKQIETTKAAKVSFKLYNGTTLVKSFEKTLPNMNVGQTFLVEFDTPLPVPKDLVSGSYYVITITDSDGEKLASDYVIKYNK